MEQKKLQERRKYYNAKILSYIGYMLNKYPDLRFTQLLFDINIGTGIDNKFSEEPLVTYIKLKKDFKEM